MILRLKVALSAIILRKTFFNSLWIFFEFSPEEAAFFHFKNFLSVMHCRVSSSFLTAVTASVCRQGKVGGLKKLLMFKFL